MTLAINTIVQYHIQCRKTNNYFNINATTGLARGREMCYHSCDIYQVEEWLNIFVKLQRQLYFIVLTLLTLSCLDIAMHFILSTLSTLTHFNLGWRVT